MMMVMVMVMMMMKEIFIFIRALSQADLIFLFGARLNWILHFGKPPRFKADVKIVQVLLQTQLNLLLSQVSISNSSLSFPDIFCMFFFSKVHFQSKRTNETKQGEGIRERSGTPHTKGSGSLSNDDGDGDENGKNVIGLMSKTTLHVRHALLYISLLSLHDYNVEMANFTFYGERKQATMNFSFSFLTNESSPQEINSREICLHFTFSVNWNKCDKV